ncbi:MAG: DUF3253 domain-containing protein [Balneolaceae bacterium]|nr:DUF3253 domain-containing protein [Balneolaceae bacterium]
MDNETVRIRRAILELIGERGQEKSISPSEIAPACTGRDQDRRHLDEYGYTGYGRTEPAVPLEILRYGKPVYPAP